MRMPKQDSTSAASARTLSFRRPELLAPAGSPAAACAALHYGADAIYLGLTRFSARAEAVNFSPEELAAVLGLAHTLTPRRRVYVTVNTLVRESELEALLAELALLEELGVDAVLVQDLGVVGLLRRHFPHLAWHASTQMAVHNLAGARALAEMGCARVVLARELDLEEIGRITAGGGLETEVFVHGALCYSYSGLCLYSALTQGRSGNRGRCAYGCREACVGAPRLPFSMRDLDRSAALEALTQAGVAAFKLEGRMKSPLYVAAVTDFYRRLIDGELAGADLSRRRADIQTLFSRPVTSLGLRGGDQEPVIDAVHTGHRGALVGRVSRTVLERNGELWLEFECERELEKHDGLQVDLPEQIQPYGFAVTGLKPLEGRSAVRAGPGWLAVLLPADAPVLPAGARVYCASSQAVKRSYPFPALRPTVHRQPRPLTLAVRLQPSGAELEAQSTTPAGATVCASVRLDGPLAPARNPAGTQAALEKAWARAGEAGWEAAALTIENPAGVFLPPSQANAARRILCAELGTAWDAQQAARLAEITLDLAASPAPPSPGAAAGWFVKVGALTDLARAAQWARGPLTECILEVPPPWPDPDALCLALAASPAPVRLALPPILRAGDESTALEWVRRGLAAGLTRWEAANGGALWILRQAGATDITGDWPLYTCNHAAWAQWQALGLRAVVLAPEDEPENWGRLLSQYGAALQVPVEMYAPLFISAHQPADGPGPRRTRAGLALHTLERGGVFYTVADTPWRCPVATETLRAAGAQAWRVDHTLPPDA
ncbi:MAG: U32 family peptidase [Candidatus Marinimicrobia bacterium]|nr:U32 family peptidase [Candidatus Neomarinimicrobiota bacterium]